MKRAHGRQIGLAFEAMLFVLVVACWSDAERQSAPSESGDLSYGSVNSSVSSELDGASEVLPDLRGLDEGDTAGPLTVHFHERVPYMSRRGEDVVGLTADRLVRVMNEANVPFVWKETPPRRQMEILAAGGGRHAFLGWFKTPERERLGVYSLPLFVDSPAIAIARAGVLDPTIVVPLREVLGNPDLRLLVRDGYSYGVELDRLIEQDARNRETTTVENLAMLQMIHAGRADYFFIAEREARELIAASDLPSHDFVLVRFKDMPPGNRRYVLYTKGVEGELISRVDEAVGRLFSLVDEDS